MRILLIGNGFDISHCRKFKFSVFFKNFVKPFFKCKSKKIIKLASSELKIDIPNVDNLESDSKIWIEIFETALYKLERFDSFENLFEYLEEGTREYIGMLTTAKKIEISDEEMNDSSQKIILFFKQIMLAYFFKLDALEIKHYAKSRKYLRHTQEKFKISFSKYDYCLTTNYTKYLDMIWDRLKQSDLENDRNPNKVIHLHGAFDDQDISSFLDKSMFDFNIENIVWGSSNEKETSEKRELEKYLIDLMLDKKTSIKLDIFGFSVDKDNNVIVNMIEHIKSINVDVDFEIKVRFFYFDPSDLSCFNDFVTENEAFLRKKRVKVFKEPYQNFYGIYSDKIIKK
jgi:hypothetical protein